MVEANTSTEERTVYMYVEAMDAEYTIISAVFTITQAAPVPLYAVSFELDGGTFVPNEVFTEDIVEVEAGTYALPSATKDGYTFDGWNDGTQTYAAGANYTVSDDVEFIAQWTENTTPSGSVTDVLNWQATGSPTNYADWTYNAPSGAVYKGQSSGTYQSIQLRSNNNNSGIVTTTSAGKVTKVTVTWNNNTQNGRTLNVYGKNTAYTAATDLYGDNAGTLLGTIVKGTSTELNITGNYAFIGLRSASSAMYLDEIDITWAGGEVPTPVPTITVTPATAQAFTYVVENGPSEEQLFEPTGTNLTSDITVTVTENGAFEIISGSYSEYGYTVTSTGDNDGVFVRLKAGLEAGSYTDNLTFSSEGATDVVIALTGTVTTPVVDMTIAEVRAQGTGDVITTGIVTSCVGTTGYIQDATAAICVYGTSLTVGDEIRVAGTLDDYNGLLEIKNPTVEVLSSGNTIDPELMTIAEINASTNQGWYVRIENATVTAINNKNTTIAQGENNIVVYNITGVEYAVNDVISLNGNIGYHNAIQIANPTNVEVAVAGYAYQYSINGVLGNEQHGTEITLSNGTAVGGLAFAGWTLDPNDVENILAAGSSYELEEDGVVFYAVYSRTIASGSYVKVTEMPEDWEGNYLIVSEADAVAFNGGLQPLDVAGNIINVRFGYDNNIVASYETNMATFTIEPIVEGEQVTYAIMSHSGLYIGRKSTATGNGMDTSSETIFSNSISFDDDYNFVVVGENGAALRYNATNSASGLRFRYYNNSYGHSIQLYKQEGEITTTSSFYTRVFADETATADITIVGPSIIPSNYNLNMDTYTLTNEFGAANLVIEENGQLIHSVGEVAVTMQKHINRYYGDKDNYYLIAAPFYVDPAEVDGMLDNAYDLYYFASWAPGEEWQNYETEAFVMWDGQGFLYANNTDTDLEFVGEVAPSTDNEYEYYVEHEEGSTDPFNGWSLAGNPFACNAYPVLINGTAANFYKISGEELVLSEEDYLRPLEGVFMQATEGTAEYRFNRTASTATSAVDLTVSKQNVTRGTASIDRARIRFDQGDNFGKFQLNPNSTKIFFTQGENDFAVVRSNGDGEMPVSFKASENGTYTIVIDPKNVDMNYLHLIDNMTGADVDLLAEPSYTFEANTTDYANRFRLVFNANNVNENANETFAYNNGSAWVISNQGEATLQVIDVTGRMISSETINGNATINLEQVPGVYMMRLVSGNDVKVQKVIIK